MERRYPRRPGRFWTWHDPVGPKTDGPPRSLQVRVLTAAGAVTGLVFGVTASWLVLLVVVATVFLLIVATVVLLFTSMWPWVVVTPLVFATLLLRRLGRSSGRPREPRDIRESS